MRSWRNQGTIIAFATIGLSAPPPAHAADLWSGTWVLNDARSLSAPPPLRIDRSGSDYTVGTGSGQPSACDGRDHAEGDRTLRCTIEGSALIVTSSGGAIRTRTTYKLQPDDRTLVATSVTTWPETPMTTEVFTYTRRNASPSLTGPWAGIPSAPVAYRDALELRVHDGRLYFRDAHDGEASDAKLDGTPASFSSPGLPTGALWSNALASSHTINGYNVWRGTRTLSDVLTLSADGKTITLTSPQQPGLRFIYEKR